MLNFIDNLKQKIYLQIFTIYLRYLIGGAFVIAAFGMGKVRGKANLLNSLDSPIEQLAPMQQFFRVMVDSGLYWQFIGWSQILAGVLLMTQKFARLGALMFFVLILNILVITMSYGFTGTPIVTGLMLIAVVYLLVWDLPAYLPLIQNKVQYESSPLKLADSQFWIGLGVVMFLSIVILAFLYQSMFMQLGIPFLEGLMGFIAFMIWRRKISAPLRINTH